MWLYEGNPSTLSSSVGDAPAVDGGYVLVLLLENHEVRLLATRFPTRYLNSYTGSIKRFGGEKLQQVLVTQQHIFYERIKRTVVDQIKFNEATKPSKLTYEEVKALLRVQFSPTTRIASTVEALA